MIDVATLATILVSWTAVLAGVIRLLVARALRDLDDRLSSYDTRIRTLAEDAERVDDDIKRVLADYQRREDGIREVAVLTARIDAVGARIDSFVRREDYLHHETILNYKLDALADRLGRALGDK